MENAADISSDPSAGASKLSADELKAERARARQNLPTPLSPVPRGARQRTSAAAAESDVGSGDVAIPIQSAPDSNARGADGGSAGPPSCASHFSAATDAIAHALHAGSTRALPPAIEDASPERAALVRAAAPRPEHGEGVNGIRAAATPVFSVRVLEAAGSLAALPAVRAPRVRAHLVDLATGRYLAAPVVVSPPDGHPVETVPHHHVPADSVSAGAGAAIIPASGVVHAAARLVTSTLNSVVSSVAAALGGGPSAHDADAPAPATHCAQTQLSLNRSVSADAQSLFAAGLAASADPLDDSAGMGRAVGRLLWGSTLAFGVPHSTVFESATAAVLFEIIEHVGGAGGVILSHQPGDRPDEFRAAWGLLRLVPGTTLASRAAESRVALTFPRNGDPPQCESFATLASTMVQLYRWNPNALPPPLPPHAGAEAAPSVFWQYTANVWNKLDIALRVAPFGGVIPAVRYYLYHDVGATFYYETSAGKYDRVHNTSAAFSEHPLLGRPKHLMRISVDAHVSCMPGGMRETAASAASLAAEAADEATIARTDLERDADEDDIQGGYLPSAIRDTRARLVRARPRVGGSADFSPVPRVILGALPAAPGGVSVISFSPCGSLIAVGCVANEASDGAAYGVRLFEATSGREACVLLDAHVGLIYSVDWAADGRAMLVASADGSAVVWKLVRSGGGGLRAPPVVSVIAHAVPSSFVYSARFHPASPSVVVTAAYDGGLRLWDVRGGGDAGGGADDNEPAVPTAARFCGFIGAAPDGGSGEHAYVNAMVWDTPANVTGATRRLLTGDSSGVLRIFDAESAITQNTPHLASAYAQLDEVRLPALRNSAILALAIRPAAASAGVLQVLVLGQAGVLRLVDAETHYQLRIFSGVRATAHRIDAAFSPCGRVIAAGSEDGALCLWDAESAVAYPTTVAGANVGLPSMLLTLSWSPTTHALALGGFGPYTALVVGF